MDSSPKQVMVDADWDKEGKWTSAAQAFFLLTIFCAVIAFGTNFRFLSESERYIQPITENFSRSDSLPKPETVQPPPNPEPGKTPPPEPEPQAVQTETPAEISLRREEEKRKKDEEEARKKREEEKRRREEEKKREEDERKKREEEKRLAEEKKREEKERKKREEERKLAESQAEEDRKKREEERKLAESQAEEERQKREEERKLAEVRLGVLENLKESYIRRIISKIRPHLVTPPEARGIENLEVIVEIHLDTDGSLEGLPQILETSGIPEYDGAVFRGILKSGTLPMPKEPELLEEFRVLNLRITPE